MQRRNYKRILAPHGAKGLLKGSGHHMACAQVLDISEGGMQIRSNSPKDQYSFGSIINEIVVTIPAQTPKEQGDIARKIIPLVHGGKVVRTLCDQELSQVYYGISFIDDSAYVMGIVRGLVRWLDNHPA